MSKSIVRRAGLIFVILLFAASGTLQFIATDIFASIIPPSLPFRREAVYISGACERAGALDLCPCTRPLRIVHRGVVFADPRDSTRLSRQDIHRAMAFRSLGEVRKVSDTAEGDIAAQAYNARRAHSVQLSDSAAR